MCLLGGYLNERKRSNCIRKFSSQFSEKDKIENVKKILFREEMYRMYRESSSINGIANIILF